MAPDVGMLLATPVSGLLRMHLELAANNAKQSLGVTKKLLFNILLFSQNHVSISIAITSCAEIR
jgi:hypothetical protein